MEVVGLLTTINAEFGRVAMHATRQSLLEAQARAVGLPLLTVPIPWPCTNAQYEAAFLLALTEAKSTLEVTHIAFGDLFLEDVRAYREAQLQGTGLDTAISALGPADERTCRGDDCGWTAGHPYLC